MRGYMDNYFKIGDLVMDLRWNRIGKLTIYSTGVWNIEYLDNKYHADILGNQMRPLTTEELLSINNE